MPRRSLFAALAVVALVGVAGCGGSEDEASRCEPVPAWFLESLEDGLREEGRTLGDSAAVQSSDPFDGPLHFGENAWFVSVDVRPKPGIETFFMSDETFRTPDPLGPTSGLITGAGPEPSAWRPGPGQSRGILDSWGISLASDGLTESVKCVGQVLPLDATR